LAGIPSRLLTGQFQEEADRTALGCKVVDLLLPAGADAPPGPDDSNRAEQRGPDRPTVVARHVPGFVDALAVELKLMLGHATASPGCISASNETYESDRGDRFKATQKQEGMSSLIEAPAVSAQAGNLIKTPEFVNFISIFILLAARKRE
jgi:hypothetical protein